MRIMDDSTRSVMLEADRIRTKADRVGATGDHREAERLRLIAECLWPSDPAAQIVDMIETQENIARLSARK